MRVVIAEDSALFREGLIQVLARFGHHVAAAVQTGDELLAAVATRRPHVAVVDVRLPPSFRDEGLRAAIQIRHDHPDVGVLVLSQSVAHASAAELLGSGDSGVGYLLKDRVGDVPEFIDALHRVAAGGSAIDPEVLRQLLTAGQPRTPLSNLTPRETEVLALIAEGRSNAAIAERLFVTEAAVAKHVNNIFSKLGLPPDRSDHRRVLAVLAYLRG